MNKYFKIIEKYRVVLFLFLLATLYFILDYQTILFLRPQGIHFIRQTDGLSFVSNYYKNGVHFFQPQVFSLNSIDGKAACEFPILYYITALMYLIFNEHEFFLKGMTILIASVGFVYLFRMIYSLLNDLLYALGFTFLFVSSTVLLYYTNNFLPDPSALGLTFIGWYFYFKSTKNQDDPYSLGLSFLFFLISSLIRVTYFINPITVIATLLILDFFKTKKINTVVSTNWKPLGYFLFSFLIVFSWNLYVTRYNAINHDNYFLIHSTPIWDLSKVQIAEVWEYMTNFWYTKYYYQTTFHVFYLISILGILFLKKSDRNILIPSFILAIGGISYFLLFFYKFQDHDYYFITLIPVIVLLVINFFVTIRNRFPKLLNHVASKLVVLILCVLSLNFASQKLKKRYAIKDEKYAFIGEKLAETREYLDAMNIPKNAKFIIVGDHTPNGGLYFINRSGWSIGDTNNLVQNIQENFIPQGAEYILLASQMNLRSDKWSKIGENKGIQIFKVK